MGPGQSNVVEAASLRQGLEGLFQPEPFCDLQCFFPSSYFCVLHTGLEEKGGWQTQHTSAVGHTGSCRSLLCVPPQHVASA